MLLAALALAAAQPTTDLSAPLAPFAFLVGHCWQAEIAPGRIDTHCFDAPYGGHFIRDRHEVTGGYGGETLYSWDAAAGRFDYLYWNNAGGVARGTMRPHDGALDFADGRYRDAQGRERSTSTTWRQRDTTSYEVLDGSGAIASHALRYTRIDAAPVRTEALRAVDGTRTLVHEGVIAAAPAEVYRALTSAEGWRTWAVPHAWADSADPDLLETAYAPDARPGAATNIRQRFLLRVPDRLVAFRTVQTPAGFPHAEEYKRVTTLIELEPVVGGTRLRLSGIGYPAGAAGDELLDFFREGNRETLEQLQARFVTGPIDWAARARAASQAH